jgi:glycosyltransferase involved in cell wall biosynthesis
VDRITDRQANVVVWRHGIDVPNIPLLGANGRSSISIVAPRPWDPLYNNSQVVDGLSEYAQHHRSDPLSVLFCGPRAGQQDLEKLAKLDRSFGPTQRLSIVDGYDFDNRFRVFGDNAVTISLSKSDGTANCVLEAMASGSLPVLSDIPANRILIEKFGIFAELVAIGDPGALRRALERISDRRDEWADLARTNRSLVEGHFSTGVATPRLCSLMEAVVQR